MEAIVPHSIEERRPDPLPKLVRHKGRQGRPREEWCAGPAARPVESLPRTKAASPGLRRRDGCFARDDREYRLMTSCCEKILPLRSAGASGLMILFAGADSGTCTAHDFLRNLLRRFRHMPAGQ